MYRSGMRLLPKILIIFTITLLFIAGAGVLFAVVSFRNLQNTLIHELQEIALEQEPEEIRISANLLAYFHALEYLVAQKSINKRARGFDPMFAGTAAAKRGFHPAVQKIDLYQSDFASLDEFLAEIGQEQLKELFNDQGFIAYLETRNLVLSRQPYEDLDFIFFDFLTLDGTRAGSLGIQKRIGRIYLFDDEYVSLGAIQTFGLMNSDNPPGLGFDLDTLPQGIYERGRIHTVLLAGTDQRLADTLILAIASEDTQTIDLFSMPRDIFFNGQKINEFLYHHGPRRLVSEMENMTGFAIDNFIVIDMYAFIDVINILGGVEITLNAPLIDPTYRVRINGHWSTLFFPAGTHRLNGTEALRVARSRHFVSDFGRARHQQLILAAIVDEINGFGITDIGRVFELAAIFLHYVETDYTPYDLLRNILRFRSARVRNQIVFSTENILYHTHSNLWRMGLEADEVDEDFDIGQYILLPLNDDWSLIHRFIRSVIEGE